MQKGRGDSDFIQSKVCRYAGHSNGMGHVGFAGAAKLTFVRIDGGNPRATDELDVSFVVVFAEPRHQALNRTQQHGIGRGSRSETNHEVSLPVR